MTFIWILLAAAGITLVGALVISWVAGIAISRFTNDVRLTP